MINIRYFQRSVVARERALHLEAAAIPIEKRALCERAAWRAAAACYALVFTAAQVVLRERHAANRACCRCSFTMQHAARCGGKALPLKVRHSVKSARAL